MRVDSWKQRDPHAHQTKQLNLIRIYLTIIQSSRSMASRDQQKGLEQVANIGNLLPISKTGKGLPISTIQLPHFTS